MAVVQSVLLRAWRFCRPHQRHRPIPGRQIPHPRWAAGCATALATRTPGTNPSRPSFRSRTRPRRPYPRPPTRPCLPARASPWHYCCQSTGAFQFVFRNTTNHQAPGPFPNSANQPCHPTTTTLHHEEPQTGHAQRLRVPQSRELGPTDTIPLHPQTAGRNPDFVLIARFKQVTRSGCGFRNRENSGRRIRFHCTRKQRAATRTSC